MTDKDSTRTGENPEILADITDQTIAVEEPGDVPSAENASSEDDLESLRQRLAEARSELAAKNDAHLRALADFANFKRRTEEEKEKLRVYMTEDLLLKLLPIIDNFERALQAAQTTQDYDKLIDGVSAILRQLQDYLTKAGVNPIEAVGQPFDPNFHNAVMRDETTEYPDNTVVEELQKGYALGDRVLRPSMVKVATGTE